MARKATDLLDVFRFGGDGSDDESKDRAASAKPKRARARKARTTSGAGGFQGIILTRRQLVLGGSGLVLLFVLSFVLGLAAGRPGSDAPTDALQRHTPDRLMIRGTLPRVHPATQSAVDLDEVRTTLVEQYRVPAQNLRIQVIDGRLVIDIGPFGSEERARTYLQRTGLDMAVMYGSDPFLRHRILPYGQGR